MRRIKKWWQGLNKQERSELVYLERADKRLTWSSPYLPCDSRECPACGEPGLGVGLCLRCSKRIGYLIEKANSGVNKILKGGK